MTNEMFSAFADIFPEKKQPKYYDLFYAPLERYLKGLVVDDLRKESWLSESECVRKFQKATSSMRQLAVYCGILGEVKERFLQILKNYNDDLQKL